MNEKKNGNHSVRIAVVDDEKTILQAFQLLMRQTDFTVDLFSNTREAYQAITSDKKYSLLLTDIYMDTDGIAFAKKVREVFPQIPVIFMTGHASDEKKKEALELGRVTFLEKPFPLVKVLKENIKNFIEQSKSV